MNIGAIYKITNIINGKFYIGSAVDFDKRKKIHLYHLQKNSHHNKILQKAWNKYGIDSFVFEILEISNDRTKIIEREQYYLDLYKPYDIRIGYNICKIAGSWFGNKHTEKTKEIIRLKTKGRSHTEEEKIKMRENHPRLSGKDHPNFGKKLPIEQIEKRTYTFIKNYKKENHPFHNKKLSKDHIERLRKKSSGNNNPMYNISVLSKWEEIYGIEMANSMWKESNKKRSINCIGKNNKAIIQKDKEGVFIKEFASLSIANFETKINLGSIGQVCLGKRKYAGGYIWEYKNINNK